RRSVPRATARRLGQHQRGLHPPAFRHSCSPTTASTRPLTLTESFSDADTDRVAVTEPFHITRSITEPGARSFGRHARHLPLHLDGLRGDARGGIQRFY